MVLLKTKLLLSPMPERRQLGRITHEAQIQFIVIYGRLSGIALRQKLQHHAIAESRWERNVRLQRNAFAHRSWEPIAKTRHGRIATIGADQRLRGKGCSSRCFNCPTVTAGQSRYRCLFVNLRAELPCSRHQQHIKQAAFDCDLALFTGWKIDYNSSAADCDELYGIEFRMWQCPDPLDQIKAVKDRPAGWIQTIAANFFAWKLLSIEEKRPQSSGSAKRGASRSSRTGADDCHIEGFHRC